ncbi:hypothetical protein PAEPH01_2270, partial [Pancytospora epiphaga]
FGSKYWPSYFLLACTCEPGVLSEFQKYWINNSIAWNGLTSSLLLGADKRPMCDNGTYIDFVSYQQFVYLNRFRGIELLTDDSSDGMKTRETWKNREESQKQGNITGHGQGEVTGGQCKHNSVNFNLLPIFLLDFACMKSDKKLIKEILENTPEAGALSRLSFIVQSEEHLILILSRYGFRTEQEFNGHTPLHISCYNNDFCTLSILLYLGFPIARDRLGHFPNEVGSHKMREKCSIFFNICADIPVNKDGVETRTFSRLAFREHMDIWIKVLKYNPNEFDKYIGIFRYLDFNRNNKILRKSRFNITSIFSSSRSAVSVEASIQRLMKIKVELCKHSVSEALILYSRYYG